MSEAKGLFLVDCSMDCSFSVEVDAHDEDEAVDIVTEMSMGELQDYMQIDDMMVHDVTVLRQPTRVSREDLTSLEEAMWMNTGKIPAEALARIRSEMHE
jgi:hypothetical protein